MLEKIVTDEILFYLIQATIFIGILSRIVVGVTIKRLLKAAGNMAKSDHTFIKYLKAKFEHACMVNSKVNNVEVFVDKHVHEYRNLGIRLHSWRMLEKSTIWGCGILTILGILGEYAVHKWNGLIDQYMTVGVAGMVILILLFFAGDEEYKIRAIKVYLVDYLENVYAKKKEKAAILQKMEEELPIVEEEKKEFVPEKEDWQNAAKIREILEEFLTP